MPESLIASFRSSLNARPQVGLAVMYPAAGLLERIAADWDWIWIDGQHGEFDYTDILGAVRACDLRRRPSVVRVPELSSGQIGRALDTGAAGLMVPMVENAQEARSAVEAACFPPLGRRSYGGRRIIDLYGRGYSSEPSLRPLVICQIESPEAVSRAPEIAAVEGVDAIFFGADDRALRGGHHMGEPVREGTFDEDLRTVVDAARAHGKIAGGVFPTPATLRKALEWGYRLVVGAAEVSLIVQGSHELARTMRQCCDQHHAPGGNR